MLASLIVVFREVMEAGLIVGIVLAATQGVAGRLAWIGGGIAAGVLGAILLAAGASTLSGLFDGVGQEVFTATILLIAVVMLGWHNLWMSRHGRQVARQMRTLGQAVTLGQTTLLALAVVVGLAVLREGAEVVLFLYGIAASTQAGAGALALGGALGIVGGALVSVLVYRGLLAIPVHRLFSVTGWLIALLAAGMAGQAAAILAGVDLLPSWGYRVWDTSWLLPEHSLAGRVMHVLVGYSERPMGVQLAAYAAVLLVLVLGMRLMAASQPSASAPKRRGAA